MQTFKQYLKESTNDFAPWHITDPKQIQKYSDDNNLNSHNEFNILSTGKLNALKSFTTFNCGSHAIKIPGGYGLPFSFSIARSITFKSTTITDAWGLPRESTYLTINFSKIQTLDHLKGSYSEGLYLDCPKLTTLGNAEIKTNLIHLVNTGYIPMTDFAKSVEGLPHDKFGKFSLVISPEMAIHYVKKPLLAFLKIKATDKKILKLGFHGGVSADNKPLFELQQAINIINKHTDAWKCQDELQDADLDDYADF